MGSSIRTPNALVSRRAITAPSSGASIVIRDWPQASHARRTCRNGSWHAGCSGAIRRRFTAFIEINSDVYKTLQRPNIRTSPSCRIRPGPNGRLSLAMRGSRSNARPAIGISRSLMCWFWMRFSSDAHSHASAHARKHFPITKSIFAGRLSVIAVHISNHTLEPPAPYSQALAREFRLSMLYGSIRFFPPAPSRNPNGSCFRAMPFRYPRNEIAQHSETVFPGPRGPIFWTDDYCDVFARDTLRKLRRL